MAYTLETFLIKLGFDITGLAGGAAAAQQNLNSIAGAAQNVATLAAPAAAALNNLNRAAMAVRGSSGSTNTIRSLASAAADVAKSTGNSAPAMNAFASSAKAIAAATGSASTVNAFARAVGAVATATGDPAKVTAFAKQAANDARLISGQAGGIQRLRDSFNAVRAAAMGAGSGLNVASSGGNAAASGARNAANGANAAAAGANNASGAALRAGASFRTMGQQMDSAANRGSFLNRVLSMAFAFGGGVAVTTVFGFIASAVAGFNSRLEQSHIAFETLIGDAKSADAFITKMMRFAELTPFDFAGLEDAAQRLMAMGFTADQVLPALTAIGDAVSALGGSKEKIDRVSLAIGQMITAGRVNAQDMRQLTEAGIPAWGILADAIGKTVAETRKMAENGLIPASQAVEALLNGMEQKFGGLMARQARTAQGAFSTILDTMKFSISGAVQPAFELVSQGMVAFADFLVNGGGRFIAPVIQAIGVAISMFLIPRLIGMGSAMASAEIVVRAFGMTFVWMSRLSAFLAITAIFTAWQEDIGGIRSALTPLISSLLQFVGAIVKAASASGLLNAAIIIMAAVMAGRLIWQIGSMILGSIALAGAFTGLTVSSGATTVAVGGLAGAIAFLDATLLPLIIPIGAVILAVGLLYTAITAVLNLLGITNEKGEKFKSFVELIGTGIDTLTEKLRGLGGEAIAPPTLDPFKNIDLGGDQFISATQTLVERFGVTIQGVTLAAHGATAEAMKQMTADIQAGSQAPIDALIALRDATDTALQPMSQVALLVGMSTSYELAQGLNSGTPAVRAAAEAWRLSITTQLDAITDGAFSASLALADLLKLQSSLAPPTTPQGAVEAARLNDLIDQTRVKAEAWNSRWKPSVDASTAALAKMNAELAKTKSSAALGDLSSALNDVRQTAHRYFDEVHRDNLRLIDDALKHKNAILDAKAALNQAPVTAAQSALDFQRRQIEEWRLRNAVATAQGPEAQRDAILALQDFLAQSHINDMQQQVDAAQKKIDQQKQTNNDLADKQRAAEDARYNQQAAAFDRDMSLLEKSLAEQKMTWQQGQEAILGLLAGYGINFATVGSQLGSTFVLNLKDQIDLAITALKTMSAGLSGSVAGVGPTPPGAFSGGIPYPYSYPGGEATYPGYQPGVQPVGGTNTGTAGGSISQSYIDKMNKVPSYDTGNWNVMANQLAMIHKGEMVVPSGVASGFREPSRFAQSMGTASTGNRGGATIVFKVGDEVLGEMTDRRLAVQDDIYGNDGSSGLSGQR